jgi:hypothetical protein
MHYRKVISLPYMYTLCTLMPELIPYLMLMLIHSWYEESTPHDHCTHNLNYGPFVSQCDAIGAIMCQRPEFMSMLQTLLGGWITIFVNLGFFRHFETVTNIRTWIKSHKYWRML